MEMVNIANLSFSYPDTDEKVLDNLSLGVEDGEFVVICGPSGCGKTTLLRLMKKELSPVGNQLGDITYRGKPLDNWDEQLLAEEIGFVFQDPDNQIVMDDVMQEMVFGMENIGLSHVEMRKRVAEMVHFFGMEDLMEKKSTTLSGGQKQTLNLLSVLLLKPKILLLDEPTSQLDPVAAKNLLMMLERLNNEMGMTIILVEHRLEELFAPADRIVMMDGGKIAHEGAGREVIQSVYHSSDTVFSPYIPSIAQLYLEKKTHPVTAHTPLTVKEARQWLINADFYHFDAAGSVTSNQLENLGRTSDSFLSLKDVYFQYERHAPHILRKLSFSVEKGEYMALVGGNGSGKTTLLKACMGLLKPQRGSVQLSNKETSKQKVPDLSQKIAYLPQNPRTYFVHDSLRKEMQETVQRNDVTDGKRKIDELTERFGIGYLMGRHPYDCSGGEMQKAALSCMLLAHPEILFVDEPTKGLDPLSKKQLAHLLSDLNNEGLTIVMVTHDIEFAALHAKRCAMLFNGEIAADGTPEEILEDNYFYTTAINRATRSGNVPEVLTLEEAFRLWPSHHAYI